MLSKLRDASDFEGAARIAHSYWIVHSALGTPRVAFLSALVCSLPTNFAAHVSVFFKSNLHAHLSRNVPLGIQLSPAVTTHNADISETGFQRICELSRNTGLMDLIAELVVETTSSHLEDCIDNNIAGAFEQRLLDVFLRWNHGTVVPWLEQILGYLPKFENYKSQIRFHIFKVFCHIRVDELFDIIVEYPTSEPALTELKISVFETDQYKFLQASLIEIILHRLLHLGAKTTEIVSLYVSSIKCLNYLDPSGDLLQSVSDLIKNYLRTRPDSIKSVINLLTGDSIDSEDVNIDFMNEAINDETKDMILATHHKPHVLDAAPPADITTSLIQVFDSPDIFIREFQGLLAERLMGKTDYDTDAEVQNLELLKKYFAESKLLQCDVMIKDIAESKRLNTNITNSLAEDEQFIRMKILSRLYWPNLHIEHHPQPPCIQEFLSKYCTLYSKLKSMRSLRMVPSLGTVELDLELQDRTLSFTVTPAQAALIGFFQENGSWSFNALERATGKTGGALDKLVAFWVGKGILKQEGNFITVLETSDESQASDPNSMEEAILFESSQTASTSELMDTMKPYLMFIKGMMTNLGALTTERIQAMLTQFAFDYKQSPEILQMYLDILVEDDVLEYGNGEYSIKK